MPTPSWTVSFTMPTASNSPAKACAGHETNRTRRLDQPPSPVTQIYRPARLATRAASFRYGGRHHSGIPGDIIPLYPGGFVGIRILLLGSVLRLDEFRFERQHAGVAGCDEGRRYHGMEILDLTALRNWRTAQAMHLGGAVGFRAVQGNQTVIAPTPERRQTIAGFQRPH